MKPRCIALVMVLPIVAFGQPQPPGPLATWVIKGASEFSVDPRTWPYEEEETNMVCGMKAVLLRYEQRAAATERLLSEAKSDPRLLNDARWKATLTSEASAWDSMKHEETVTMGCFGVFASTDMPRKLRTMRKQIRQLATPATSAGNAIDAFVSEPTAETWSPMIDAVNAVTKLTMQRRDALYQMVQNEAIRAANLPGVRWRSGGRSRRGFPGGGHR